MKNNINKKTTQQQTSERQIKQNKNKNTKLMHRFKHIQTTKLKNETTKHNKRETNTKTKTKNKQNDENKQKKKRNKSNKQKQQLHKKHRTTKK